jgi:hypothetical protein
MTTGAARRRWEIFLLKALGGSAIGAAMAAGALVLMQKGVFTFRDYLPLIMATLYVLTGLTVWINPYVRKTSAPNEALWPRCLLMIVSGAALAAPALMPSRVEPLLALGIVALLWFISWRIMRYVLSHTDELLKRVMVDANQMSVACLLPVLFLYAAAERLGIVSEGMSIWVVNGIVVWVYFMMSQFAWMRRGLDNPMVAEE